MTRTYVVPASVEDAVRALADDPGTAVIAGGTDLIVGARQRKRTLPGGFVAIHRLSELKGRDSEPGGPPRAGALVTHADLETSPVVRGRWTALADASALVGSPATRNVGTIGGNLVNGSPAMEVGSPLLVFEAEVELRSTKGARVVPVGDFLLGPGRTAAAPGELLTAVTVPAPPDRSGSAYVRLEYRRAMEIAVVGAAALVSLADDGRVADARIALTAVAPTCVRADEAAESLRGAEPSADALATAAERAADVARPITDVRGTERYRRALVPVIVRRALDVAVRRARGEDVPVPANQALEKAA